MLQVQLLGEVQRPFWQAGEQVAIGYTYQRQKRVTFVDVPATSSLAVVLHEQIKSNVVMMYVLYAK